MNTLSAPGHVLVTGVSRGLGRALAVDLARRGHTVSGCARSEPEVRALSEELGPPHSFAAVDVRDAGAVGAWVDTITAERLPELVLLNAGIANRPAPLWEVSAEDVERTVGTAVEGFSNFVRALVPRMAERGRGIIVATTSGLGVRGAPGMAPYCASKWAVEGLVQALALELPEGLAVVAFEPGMIDTEMLRLYLGPEAADFPSPESWVEDAADLLLSLDVRANGQRVALPRRGHGQSFGSKLLDRLGGSG